MAQTLLKVGGQTLTLFRNPEVTEIEKVKNALYELAGAAGAGDAPQDAVLDLSVLPGVSSTTVGMTVAAHLRFAEAGKRLRVRLNPQLLKLFELTMLTGTLTLEMVGKEGEEPKGASKAHKKQRK
jgi:anti-anti-sigma regulatory factor